MGDCGHFLDGQFLVAMPDMSDPRFARAVVYMCAHTEEGAMGVVVNHPVEGMTLAELLYKLGLLPAGSGDAQVPLELASQPVFTGGPVEPGRGFVLHTGDYFLPEGTLPVTESIGLTASLDILHDLVRGNGPSRMLLALGYAGWAPGQLEAELASNAWLTCAADEEILFQAPPEERYVLALRRLGIDPGSLSSSAGHA